MGKHVLVGAILRESKRRSRTVGVCGNRSFINQDSYDQIREVSAFAISPPIRITLFRTGEPIAP